MKQKIEVRSQRRFKMLYTIYTELT